MEIICPRCCSYDCYFDGLKYVCDDCGHEWGWYNPNPRRRDDDGDYFDFDKDPNDDY